MWWTDVLAWFSSPDGARTAGLVILPILGILVAGVVAGLIGRAAARSVVRHAERDSVLGAVAGYVECARRASAWGELTPTQQGAASQLEADADIRLRTGAIPGGDLAADWAALQVEVLRRDASGADGRTTDRRSTDRQSTARSVAGRSSTGRSSTVVRDGLVAWLARPSRARRMFGDDIERLRRDLAGRPERLSGRRDEAPPVAAAQPEPAAPAPAIAERNPADEPPNDAARTEPSIEAPGVEAPAVEAPAVEAPSVEAPSVEAPSVEAPAVAAPGSEPEAPAATSSGTASVPSPYARPDRSATAAPTAAAARTGAPDPHGRHAEHTGAIPVIPAPSAGPGRSQSETARRQAPAAVRAIPTGEDGGLEAQDLDEYDDEALVTRDIPLRAPSPVAANTVRERTRSGDDAARRG